MNIIEVKNLTKKFGQFTAVDDVSFAVEKGEIFAFINRRLSIFQNPALSLFLKI